MRANFQNVDAGLCTYFAVAADYVNFRYMITLLSVGCLVFQWATVKRMPLVISQLYFLKENELLSEL